MYNTANNSFGKLEAGISSSATTFIMQSAYSDLFPEHNGTTDADYFLKFEKKDSNLAVTKREIVKVTERSDNIFTIERGSGFCPSSDTAETQTDTSFSFDAGDSVSLTITSEHIQQIETDIESKATDDEVVHNTGNETIAGIKTFSSSPIVPTPTTDMQASTKKYVDDNLSNIIEDVSALYETGLIAGESITAGVDTIVKGYTGDGVTGDASTTQTTNSNGTVIVLTGYTLPTTIHTTNNGYTINSVACTVNNRDGTNDNISARIKRGGTTIYTSSNSANTSSTNTSVTFNFTSAFIDFSIAGTITIEVFINTGTTFQIYNTVVGGGGSPGAISITRKFNGNTSKRYKASALSPKTLPTDYHRIATSSAVLDGTFSAVFSGLYPYTGLTADTTYYASNTAGLISATAGTNSSIVGKTNINSKLFLSPYTF